MANSLGSLVVSLGLNAADFVSGLTKSELLAKRFGQNLDKSIAAGIKSAAVAATALVAATGAAAAGIQKLIKGAADFQDFAEMLGDSAQNVASLAVAAGTAGVGMDSVVSAANRLTKGMTGVDEESSKVRAGLKALNINIEEFKNLGAVERYEAVGKALGTFAENADKSAVAQDILGKAGAEQLKVYAALQEQGGRQVILTQAQIEAADKYADAQAKAGAQLKLMAQAAATQALPALNDLTAVAIDVARELLGIDKASGQLAASNGVKAFADAAVDSLAFAIDQIDLFSRLFQVVGKGIAGYAAVITGFARGGLSEARAAGKAAEEDIDRVLNRMTMADRLAERREQRARSEVRSDAFSDPRSTLFKGNATAVDARPKLRYAGPPDTAAAAQAEAILRKQLDGQLRAIREFGEQQREALEFADRSLQGTYSDGLLSLRQYHDSERAIRAAALASTVDALDQERAALEAALPRTKAAERIDLENKIADVVSKRSEAVRKAGYDAALSTQQESRSVLDLRNRYDDLRSTILQLAGDSEGASRIRIAQQVSEARKLLTQAGENPAQAEGLRSLLVDTERLSEAQREYSRIVERARNSEEAAMLAAQASGASELEVMRTVGALRQKALQELSGLVDKANELALALGTPDAIRFAEELGLQFKRAASEVDPLLMKLRDIGQEAGATLADGLEAFVLEGKKASDVLKDIDKQLAQIIIRQAVIKPFENWVSNQIGGTGQASGGGGGGGWIGTVLGAIGSYFTGSSAAGAQGIGGKANGGMTLPNTAYRIAENRPEVYSDGSRSWLITGNRRGSVDPNPRMGGSRTLNAPITVNVPGSTDRRTADQLAAKIAQRLAIVNQRMN